MILLDVYADLLFLINFVMDLACLKISAKVCACSERNMRSALAAAVGGVYSIAALFIENRFVYYVLSILMCPLITAVAFARRGDKVYRVLKISLVYFFISLLTGGGVSAAFYFFESFFDSVSDLPISGERILSPAVCLALSAGCFAAYFAARGIKRANIDKASGIKIYAFGGEIGLCVMVDSGNNLREPFLGKLCTVISVKDIEILIGKERARRIANGIYGESLHEKICVIPVRTVNGSSIMYGFFPKKTLLTDSSGKTIKEIDTAIAVSTEPGFEHGRAILPEKLI